MSPDPEHVDYVRIEIHHDGRAEILEITPDDWNRVKADVTMHPHEAEVGPSLTRLALATRDRPPDFTLTVSGGQARLTVEQVAAKINLPPDETWPEPALPPPPTGYAALPIGGYLTDLDVTRAQLWALPKTTRGVIVRDDPAPPFPASYEPAPEKETP